MNKMVISVATAATIMLGSAAGAVTVATGGTAVGDGFGITPQSGVSVASNNAAYSSEVTTPTSAWVWAGDINNTNSNVYTFSFDLTGYDVSTAVLSGKWGIDNIGSVLLNGNLLASLPLTITANFNTLHDYGTSVDAYFNSGLNTLVFDVADDGGAAAFRATAIVEAAAIPLPAAATLLLAGLGGLAAVGRRRKSRG